MSLPKRSVPQPERKQEVARLARASRGGVINIDDAADALGVSSTFASSRLAALARAGWLSRVRRGLYLVLPLEAASEGQTTVADPWILAGALYAPCYVGGWSAAEHWGLTEQLFRSTFIASAANVRTRESTFLGASFTIVRVKAERLAHLTPVWRGSAKLLVSSRERTVVDAAIDPRWLGGWRHTTEVFATYSTDSKSDPAVLAQELRRSGTGAAAKRIGYLAERLWPSALSLIDDAFALRTAGLIKLDPELERKGRINTRWGVRVNATVEGAAAHA